MQIAISFVVLVGAGLLVRTFVNLQRVDPGFDATNVLVVNAPNMTRFPPDKNRLLMDEVMAGVQAVPGVQAVATSSRAPFDIVTVNPLYLRTAEGRFSQPDAPVQMLTTVVSPTYFATLRIPILRGRTFGTEDVPTGPQGGADQRVAREAGVRGQGSDQPAARVVVRRRELDCAANGRRRRQGRARARRRTHGRCPPSSTPATQSSPGAALLIRTADASATAGREAARLIHDRDPKRPVTQIAWLTASAAERVAPSRLNATLFGGFAVLALTIAAIGVGGVLAFSISERTREFGIRMALGAEPVTILRGVLGEGLVLAGAGVVIGVLGALFLSRFLAGLLFEVTPFDTLTFAATCASLTLVALAAAWIPARRATRVEPTTALRAT